MRFSRRSAHAHVGPDWRCVGPGRDGGGRVGQGGELGAMLGVGGGDAGHSHARIGGAVNGRRQIVTGVWFKDFYQPSGR